MTITTQQHLHRRSGRTRVGVLLHRWHRRLGVAASVFLIWLAASGIFINEAVALSLDKVRIGWPWLMQWYGLRADAPAMGWTAGGHWLAIANDASVLDGRLLTPPIRAPLGMAAVGGLLYVATPDSIVLLKADGTRVDTLHSPPLPSATIRRIGIAGERVAIQDLEAYASDDGESWSSIDPMQVGWSQSQTLPEEERKRVVAIARPSLPLTRILADAHSGRLFGAYGVLIINLAGGFAILLAISGLWLWRRALLKQRTR